MPAVSVDDVLVLPHIPAPDAAAMQRPVQRIVTGLSTFEGEGFPVRRPFPGRMSLRDSDPFLLLDHMGAVEWGAGEPKGTPWHPHRGFETVTYIIDGSFIHQDSHGGGAVITNGDTQWMTAGSGLLHIETPPESLVVSGGLFHGLQLWVNLPRTSKMEPPRYQDLRASDVALLSSDDGGALLRVIAGELGGHVGPGSTHTPITMVHATVSPGASMTIPWHRDVNALAYVMAGSGTVGEEQRPIRTGQLAVLGNGGSLTIAADATQESRHPALEVVLLGGAPIREPIAWYGPFVMNTQRELMEAVDDFQKGRLGVVPPDALRPYRG